YSSSRRLPASALTAFSSAEVTRSRSLRSARDSLTVLVLPHYAGRRIIGGMTGASTGSAGSEGSAGSGGSAGSAGSGGSAGRAGSGGRGGRGGSAGSAATHRGGCHCGAVRYSVEIDLSGPALSCNCSMCGRAGSLLHFVTADKFTLEKGEDNLTDYQFNKQIIH